MGVESRSSSRSGSKDLNQLLASTSSATVQTGASQHSPTKPVSTVESFASTAVSNSRPAGRVVMESPAVPEGVSEEGSASKNSGSITPALPVEKEEKNQKGLSPVASNRLGVGSQSVAASEFAPKKSKKERNASKAAAPKGENDEFYSGDFFRAIKDNNIKGVRSVIENAEKHKCLKELLVRRQFDSGFTGLHMAAQFGWDEIVRHLLAVSEKQNSLHDLLQRRDRRMNATALHRAAAVGSPECCLAILEAVEKFGSSYAADYILSGNEHQATALHCAAGKGSAETVFMLLQMAEKHDCAVRVLVANNRGGSTALHLAAACAGVEALMVMLQVAKRYPKVHDNLLFGGLEEGRPSLPVHMAAEHGATEAVRVLLNTAKESSLDKTWEMLARKVGPEQYAPLHLAAVQDSAGVARELLHYCERHGRERVAEVVLGLDANQATPMHTAAQCGSVEVCRVLLKVCGSVKDDDLLKTLLESQDSQGRTVLGVAAAKEQVSIISVLLNEAGKHIHPTHEDLVEVLPKHGEMGRLFLDSLFVPAEEEHPDLERQLAWVGQDPHTALRKRDEKWKIDPPLATLVLDWFLLDLFFRWPAFFRVGMSKTNYQLYITRRAGMMNARVLHALSSTPSPHACTTMAARTIICHGFSMVFPIYVFDLLLDYAAVGFLTRASYLLQNEGRLDVLSVCLMPICTLKDFMEEMFQFFQMLGIRKSSNCCSDIIYGVTTLCHWHGWDLSRVAYEIFAVAWVLTRESNDTGLGVRMVFAIWAAWRWVKALWTMRGLRLIGPRMLPVVRTMGDLFGFVMLLVFSFAAAIHAYYLFGLTTGNSYFYDSFLRIYRLAVMRDFSLIELEGLDHSFIQVGDNRWIEENPGESEYFVAVQLFFFVVTAVMSIVLMNLLIGILGSNYDKYEDLAEEEFMKTRAHMIVAYLAVPMYYWIAGFSTVDDKHIVAMHRALDVHVPDEVRSLRTVFHHGQQAAVEKLSSRIDQVHDQLYQKMQRMQRSMEDRLDRKIDELAQKLLDQKAAPTPTAAASSGMLGQVQPPKMQLLEVPGSPAPPSQKPKLEYQSSRSLSRNALGSEQSSFAAISSHPSGITVEMGI